MSVGVSLEGLSDDASIVLDGYMILCSPIEAVSYFVDEYLDYSERNHPFLVGDEEWGDKQVLAVTSELLTHLAGMDEYRFNPDEIVIDESIRERLRRAMSSVVRIRHKR